MYYRCFKLTVLTSYMAPGLNASKHTDVDTYHPLIDLLLQQCFEKIFRERNRLTVLPSLL